MPYYEDALASWGRTADAQVDALQYEVSTLTNEVARLEAEIGQATVEKVIAEANLAECQATLADVRRQLAECQGGGGGSSLPLVNAIHSDRVATSYGVCAHVNFNTTVYGATKDWLARLDSMGTSYFRSMYAHTLPSNAVAITEARRLGLKWLATVTPEDWSQTDAQLLARLQHIKSNAADVVIAIEGVNEPNHERSGGPPPADWPQRTLRVQKIIWDFVQANMPHIQVVGPSLHSSVSTAQQDQVRLGELGIGAYMDSAGLHRYFSGRYPDYLTDERIGWIRAAYGANMPIWVTETGYTNCVNNTTQHKPVPENVSAKYGPLTVLEFFVRGCNTTRYELLDDPDPEKNDVESNFGLWRTPSLSPTTWTEKPEASAMRGFVAGLADPGPTFTPDPVPLSVTAPSTVKSLVVGKRDGSHRLLLWQRAPIFDPMTQKPMTAPNATAVVERPLFTSSVTVPAGEVVTVSL